MLIAADALPKDRVGDTQIRPDQNQNVRLFQVVVRVRRGVEAKCLFVRNDRRGHTLPRIAVTMEHTHSEFGKGAEQRHLLRGNLTRTEERDGVRAVLPLNGFDSLAKELE